MSDLYTSLHISPKKKQFLSDDEDDTSLTPKRLRPAYVNYLPLFPQFSSNRDKVHSHLQRRPKTGSASETISDFSLPQHLSQLFTVQTALQHAISHALASSTSHPPLKLGFCEM